MSVEYTRYAKGKKFIIEAQGLGINGDKSKKFGGKRCSRVRYAWLRKTDQHTTQLHDGNDWIVKATGWIHMGFATERKNVESAARSYLRESVKWDSIRGVDHSQFYETMIVEIHTDEESIQQWRESQ